VSSTDLKATTRDAVEQLRKMTNGLIDHVRSAAEDTIANLERRAGELEPFAAGGGLDLLARAAAAATFDIEAPSHGQYDWLELRLPFNSYQVRLARPLEGGRSYKALVLLVPVDKPKRKEPDR
jgi:hypothetical protein